MKAANEFSSSSVVPTYLPTAEGKLESFPEVIPHPVVVVVDDAAADAVTAALVLWIIRVLSVVFYQLLLLTLAAKICDLNWMIQGTLNPTINIQCVWTRISFNLNWIF